MIGLRYVGGCVDHMTKFFILIGSGWYTAGMDTLSSALVDQEAWSFH